jgi:hypothetical protein
MHCSTCPAAATCHGHAVVTLSPPCNVRVQKPPGCQGTWCGFMLNASVTQVACTGRPCGCTFMMRLRHGLCVTDTEPLCQAATRPAALHALPVVCGCLCSRPSCDTVLAGCALGLSCGYWLSGARTGRACQNETAASQRAARYAQDSRTGANSPAVGIPGNTPCWGTIVQSHA